MRWSLGLCGFHVAFNGIERRGPEPNCQITPSVRPWKWQLAQFCQPLCDMRSSVETVVPPGRLKWPRAEKNNSLPAWIVSSSVLGGGWGVVEITATTASVARLTTETL